MLTTFVDKLLLLERINDGVYFDGLDIKALLNDIGTPSFIFSERQLLLQYDKLNSAFVSNLKNPFQLAYSIKANPLPEVVQTFVKKNLYFEVTSLGEMRRIIELGGDPHKFIYTNIVKPQKTIEFALDHNIAYFAVDSRSDMKRIEKAAKSKKAPVRVLLRVNPLHAFHETVFSSTGPYSKVGVPIPLDFDTPSPLTSIISYFNNSPWLELVGLHIHLGSQLLNVALYKRSFRALVRLARHLEAYDVDLSLLDIGGGFPVDYGAKDSIPSVEQFGRAISEELPDEFHNITIIAESGRYLTAPAGILACSIVKLKQDPSGIPLAFVDGSFYNLLLDTVSINWQFPIINVIANENDPVTAYRINGSTNDTMDQYLPHNLPTKQTVPLHTIREGDQILFLQAGAYSLSFNATYCLEDRPYVYFHLKNGTPSNS
ncbi:MAG: diaminopimelate decarboxylase family protein [Candidatus Heimdallarchaeota archaeon]